MDDPSGATITGLVYGGAFLDTNEFNNQLNSSFTQLPESMAPALAAEPMVPEAKLQSVAARLLQGDLQAGPASVVDKMAQAVQSLSQVRIPWLMQKV